MKPRLRQYRMVASQDAGYGPGRWVIQVYDKSAGAWLDAGDPMPRREAMRRLIEKRTEDLDEANE